MSEETKIGDVVAEGAFYGACHDYFRVGDTLFRAVEDEYDGYRSALDELSRETVTDSAEGLFVFSYSPKPATP